MRDFWNVKVNIAIELEQIFLSFIQGNNSPIFRKFLQKDGSIDRAKLKNKIDTYASRHKDALISYADDLMSQDTILQNSQDASDIERQKKTIIRNILKKYIKIIFTFGEKISSYQLGMLLKIDDKTLSWIHTSYTEKLLSLSEAEKKEMWKGTVAPRMLENTHKTLFKYDKYFTLFDDIISSEQWEEEKRNKIQSSIENLSNTQINNLVQTAIQYDFKIFSLILESEGDFFSNGHISDSIGFLVEEIKKTRSIIRVFENTGFDFSDIKENIFKAGNATLLRSFVWKIPNLLKDTQNKHFAGIKKDELFWNFLESLNNSQKEQNKFWETIDTLKKTYIQQQIPKPIDDVDLSGYNAQSIDIDNWIETPEDQKYEYLFTNIFANAPRSQAENIFTLNEAALEWNKIEEYSQMFIRARYKSQKRAGETEKQRVKRKKGEERVIKKQIAIFENQMKEIKNLSIIQETDLDSLIRNTPNHMNVLVEWWRFVLKVRKLKNEWKTVSVEEIKKLPHNSISYGTMEKIIKRLPKWYEEKVSIRTNRIPNASVRNVRKVAEEKYNALTREDIHIDRADFKRKDQSWESISFAIKDITDIYMPENIYSLRPKGIKKWEEGYDIALRKLQVQAIGDWISAGIQTCNRLLGQKGLTNTEHKKYFAMLQSIGVVDSNTRRVQKKDQQKIQLFIEELKYIKAKCRDLEAMFTANDGDFEYIRSLLLSWKKNGQQVKLRPQKQFARAFEKFIKNHSANGNRIIDLGGGLSVQNSIRGCIQTVVGEIEKMMNEKRVTHISIIDKTGEPLSFAKLSTGYRDIKFLITLDSGNTIEYQIHFESMLNMKTEGPTQKELTNAVEEVKWEWMLLSFEEMNKVVQFCRKTDKQLPHHSILNMLLSEWKVLHIPNILEYGVLNPKKWGRIKELSLDSLYGIARSIGDIMIVEKVNRLHKALADIWFGPMVADYVFKKPKQ